MFFFGFCFFLTFCLFLSVFLFFGSFFLKALGFVSQSLSKPFKGALFWSGFCEGPRCRANLCLVVVLRVDNGGFVTKNAVVKRFRCGCVLFLSCCKTSREDNKISDVLKQGNS